MKGFQMGSAGAQTRWPGPGGFWEWGSGVGRGLGRTPVSLLAQHGVTEPGGAQLDTFPPAEGEHGKSFYLGGC